MSEEFQRIVRSIKEKYLLLLALCDALQADIEKMDTHYEEIDRPLCIAFASSRLFSSFREAIKNLKFT